MLNQPIAIEDILRVFTGFNPWLGVKAFLLVCLFIYFIFALAIIRQVKVFLDVLELELEGAVRLFAWLHVLLVAGVLIVAIIYL